MVTAILAASFVYYVVPRIVGLGPTLRRLRSGRIGWLALGVGLEALSMFGDIVMFRGVFAARGTPIGWRRTADIRMAGAAVAIAPAGYASRAAGIRRIGVGYDGSVESGRALQLARTLAAHHQAELFAFEAIWSPVHGRDPANVAGESQELVEEAAGALLPSAAFTLTPASVMPWTSCASTGSRSTYS